MRVPALLLATTLLLTTATALMPTASAAFECDMGPSPSPLLDPTYTYADEVCDATGTYLFATCLMVFAPHICALF